MKINLIDELEVNKITACLENVEKKLDILMEAQNSFQGDLLHNEDLCKMFGCSTRTLQNWRDRGTLKYIKPEGSNIILYKKEDVEEFMELNHPKRNSNG